MIQAENFRFGVMPKKAMKKSAGSIRIDLAQFREMEVFTQFSSDLDAATKAQLCHGNVLMELLKQPLGKPLSMAEQVITLCAANARVMENIPIEKVKDFQGGLLKYISEENPGLIDMIRSTGNLDDDLREQIVTAAKDYLAIYDEAG